MTEAPTKRLACDAEHPDGTSACRFPRVPAHRDHMDPDRRIWSDPPPPAPEQAKSRASDAARRIAGGS